MNTAKCTRCGREAPENELEYSGDGLICEACAADVRFGEMYDRGIAHSATWGILAFSVGTVLLVGAVVYGIWAWSAYQAIGRLDLRPLALLTVGGAGGIYWGVDDLRAALRSRRIRKLHKERLERRVEGD